MSHSIASKALVHVSSHPGHDSREYHMDLTFDEDTFHCKLSTAARLVTPDKRVFVYLVLDASHVQDLVVCDNHDTIPANTVNALVKQGRCLAQDDIISIRFTLKRDAPLITPNSILEKRTSSCNAIDGLLRLGQCETFEVHVPASSIEQERLSGLCAALARGVLKPAPTEVLKGLYAGAGIKTVMHLDELWAPDTLDCPPAYDEATAAGASIHESSGHSGTGPPRGRGARGKRRISPEPRQTRTKRHATAEKATQEPWKVAIAAQSIQLAALNAQLVALREEMKQLRRPPMVDAGSQTEPAPPVSEWHPSPAAPVPERHPSPATPVPQRQWSPVFYPTSASQASTIEISVEERVISVENSLMDEQSVRRTLSQKIDNNDKCLMTVKDGLINEQTERRILEEKVDNNDTRIGQNLDAECSGLEHAVTALESRVEDIENDFKDTLQQELSIELRTKLEEFIEFRLEDVEEVVKHDVRMAMENGAYKLKMELNWMD